MPKRHSPLLALVAISLAAAGCGSGGGKQGTQVEVGNTVNYGSFGTTADIDCADGKSLNVGGSNNTLKVTGSCASVSIGGADNKITLERIEGELSVVGLNNMIVYKSGEPDVNDQGSGNRINQG